MKEETKVNSTYERKSDLANIDQLASQVSACAASAKKPTLRERLETTQKAAAEAIQLAYSIRDCLFGQDGLNGDIEVEKEPESMDEAVDWMGRRLNELVGALKEVREKL